MITSDLTTRTCLTSLRLHLVIAREASMAEKGRYWSRFQSEPYTSSSAFDHDRERISNSMATRTTPRLQQSIQQVCSLFVWCYSCGVLAGQRVEIRRHSRAEIDEGDGGGMLYRREARAFRRSSLGGPPRRHNIISLPCSLKYELQSCLQMSQTICRKSLSSIVYCSSFYNTLVLLLQSTILSPA